MITCTILENGNLSLVADDPTEFADEYSHGDFWRMLCDAMEGYSCNGSFTPFDAGQANPFVGLTSATCIAESMDILDNGNQTIEGRFWYDNEYAIRDPLELLARGETVIFHLAREES